MGFFDKMLGQTSGTEKASPLLSHEVIHFSLAPTIAVMLATRTGSPPVLIASVLTHCVRALFADNTKAVGVVMELQSC